VLGEAAIRVRWSLEDGSRLVLVAALGAKGIEGVEFGKGRIVWSEGAVDREQSQLGPWSVVWTIDDGRDGSAV
jgi:hypothetical protein